MNTFSESGRFDGDWQIDPLTGKRFRMVGRIKEYEMMIHTSGGIVPESELADFYKRQKEAEERRKAEQAEALKNRPEPKSCPFATGCNTTCKREGCKIFLKGKCAIAFLADAHGAEQTDQTDQTEQTDQTQAAKCPFSDCGRCKGCALYNNGCAIVRLAAATYKE